MDMDAGIGLSGHTLETVHAAASNVSFARASLLPRGGLAGEFIQMRSKTLIRCLRHAHVNIALS